MVVNMKTRAASAINPTTLNVPATAPVFEKNDCEELDAVEDSVDAGRAVTMRVTVCAIVVPCTIDEDVVDEEGIVEDTGVLLLRGVLEVLRSEVDNGGIDELVGVEELENDI